MGISCAQTYEIVYFVHIQYNICHFYLNKAVPLLPEQSGYLPALLPESNK